MTLARVVGLAVLVVLLLAVITQPSNSAAMARSGGQALGSVGTSLGEFVSSLGGTVSTRRVSDAESGTYVVRPGDTLTSVATAHGTRVDRLAARNGIADEDLIHPGQRLRY
ncbi:LysM peptidoglycan-binding domain-containing protein [Actinomycetospora termitidis]|uniref:LysM domain-containing protein n=1 Tax=Actinomycetospora termitidis TaxID=3053470 RepID=A0ABT7MKE2_9PSEU|nr:LysM domain-containing protein [Actinomycetospora sp. Odt1-22]MDL5160397.1 LysM domain-containing protein [Actinomycetospora sp. Odt1-22]